MISQESAGQSFRRKAIIALAGVSMVCIASCRRGPTAIEIDALLQDGAGYSRQVITIHACEMNGPETTHLLSCTKPTLGEAIWVEPYTVVEAREKLFPGSQVRSSKTELPSASERRLQDELLQVSDAKLVEVVVRGEFQHANGPLYGHAPVRRNQLILYRVLRSDFRRAVSHP